MLSLANAVEGDVYRAVIRFAQFEKHTFTLVQRDTLKLQESGQKVLRELQPCLLVEERVAEWPCTRLPSVRATLRRYKLNARSADVLTSATESLFGWTQARLPEDLALWAKSGEWWLATIAHEGYGFVRGEHVDMTRLTTEIPGLMGARPDAARDPVIRKATARRNKQRT
jgi:hypothetical protein